MKKGIRLMHAIEITKRDGRELLPDKEGPMVFSSKLKARDALQGLRAAGRFSDNGKPEIVPVRVTIEKI